jgi:DNA-directed RNA polymerase subunit RPC12/RpoP
VEKSDQKAVVECSGCGGRVFLNLDNPATFVCQRCGGTEGVVYVDAEEKRNGLMNFSCCKCNEDFSIPRKSKAYLACPFCGSRVITCRGEVIFSKIISPPSPKKKAIPVLDKSGTIKSYDKSNKRVKIVLPYYAGNKRIDRAALSWVLPETVWAITDENTVPPGWGVCHQLFTPKNTLREKIHETKTKPYIMDIMRRMVDMFPDEGYYGYFNSDVILPHGVPISKLLPSNGVEAVFHHRLDLMGDKDASMPVSKLPKGNQVLVGKDGFIASREIIDAMLERMPDMVVGAPTWDDGLLLWCWREFGVHKIELRYGDILHVAHPIDWKFEEKDAVFNQRQLSSVGITNDMRWSVIWGNVAEKTKRIAGEQKTIGIVQPGRIGDIIIVLPIAKWYYDRGYRVIWPVCSEYFPLFDYVNYVEPIDIGKDIVGSYHKVLDTLRGKRVDRILDLGIGFGRKEDDWVSSKLHFNEWKYKEAGVPIEERFNLQITRNFVKECALGDFVSEKYGLNGHPYSVIHDDGTKGPYKFGNDGIRVRHIEGFTVFDWIGVIERAKHLYCVDSCVANLADQLQLCKGRRSVWFWKGIPDREPRKTLGFPKLCDDWQVL